MEQSSSSIYVGDSREGDLCRDSATAVNFRDYVATRASLLVDHAVFIAGTRYDSKPLSRCLLAEELRCWGY